MMASGSSLEGATEIAALGAGAGMRGAQRSAARRRTRAGFGDLPIEIRECSGHGALTESRTRRSDIVATF